MVRRRLVGVIRLQTAMHDLEIVVRTVSRARRFSGWWDTFLGEVGDEDEFEAEVSGAKPGVWLMSVETEESEDDEGNGFIGGIPKLLRFVWKGFSGPCTTDVLLSHRV